MKLRTRLLSLLIALLLLCLLPVFSACNDAPTPVPEETDGDTQPTESESGSGDAPQELAVHNIIENGIVNYSVVRVESATSELLKGVAALHKFLTERSSEFVNIETDYSLDYLSSGTHDASRFEFVIGNTNYAESAEILQTLGYGEYAIECRGKKIFIVSPSDAGVNQAIDDLISTFSAAYDETAKSLSLEVSAIDKRAAFNDSLADIPAFDNSVLDFGKDVGDGSYMLVLRRTSEAGFEAYVSKLKEQGYKIHSSAVLAEKNHFTSAVKGDRALNVFYTKADNTTRLIIDDLKVTDLAEIDSDWDSGKKVCDSVLIQVGTSPVDNESQNGECYLIRGEDGRFVVYDGGFGSNSGGSIPRNNIKRLYDTLVEYTPDGMTPTISAWVLTHAHADHVGAFYKFVETYSKKVNVDQFVYNYPLNDESGEVLGARAKTYDLIKQYYPDSDIVKAHAGQTFRYANVEMEVLYSIELLWPGDFDIFNTSSIVTRLFVGGQSILMPGDMSETSNNVCRNYYTNYLKSDFYQVTHHGYGGGTNGFNKLVSPSWVLWPVGETHYGKLKAHDRNSWLSGSDSGVKLHIPALFDTVVINLPFDGTDAGYVRYANK